MNHRLRFALPLSCLASLGLAALPAVAADTEIIIEDEVSIEIDGGAVDPATEILIEDDAAAPGELVIEQPDTDSEILIDAPAAPAATTASAALDDDFDLAISDARIEYAHQGDSASRVDHLLYGKLAVAANWQPDPAWEVQLAVRADAFDEDGDPGFTTVRGDYGDSYVRYRGDNLRLTLGSQTVIWGRLDELPIADRVSTTDLTRFVLDDLGDRRRSNPVLRAETFVAGGKLDLVWLAEFRPAELPDQDSIWYPIDRQSGRILGFESGNIPEVVVRNAVIDDDGPNGDGGFGARYTRTHSFADVGVTVARSRHSTPYFRTAGGGRLEAVYPRSWFYGVDAAIDAMGATWRAELGYSSDQPVTRRDLGFDTVAAVQWGGGVEFHPGDGDTRVNLQLVGTNLVDAPSILDRTEVYNLNGEIERPFDRDRWRAKLRFFIGLDEKDLYFNPEVAFLGWEPHELYLALHYFDGAENTLGGFHEDHSSVNLGWRAKF